MAVSFKPSHRAKPLVELHRFGCYCARLVRSAMNASTITVTLLRCSSIVHLGARTNRSRFLGNKSICAGLLKLRCVEAQVCHATQVEERALANTH